MKIHFTEAGAIGANCYVIETASKNCAIVDPGDRGDQLATWIDSLGVTPKMILLTHGHFDHIGGVSGLLEVYPDLPIYLNCEDKVVVDWSKSQMRDKTSATIVMEQAKHIQDGQEITLDELTFRVMYTPGHTQGSVVYLCGEHMFSGDTLFYREIGRCDLLTGNYDTMLVTLKKLADLEGDYQVYPGHMRGSTLNFERENNPYMKKVI